MKEEKQPDLQEAYVALQQARARYDEAHQAATIASHNETNAKNYLNEAQRTFDRAVAAIKKDPPWDTDWHQKLRKGE